MTDWAFDSFTNKGTRWRRVRKIGVPPVSARQVRDNNAHGDGSHPRDRLIDLAHSVLPPTRTEMYLSDFIEIIGGLPGPAGAAGATGATGASGGPPPMGPYSPWNQTAWFIDPSNVSGLANDANTGLDTTHPIVHFRELAKRWGTLSPVLSVAVTITFMSSQPDDTDRVFLSPLMVEGGALYLVGTTTTIASGTLSSVVPKNTSTADGRWRATFGSDIHGDGRLIVNTSRANSVALVHNVGSGTTCGFSQPYETNLPASPSVPNTSPAEHNDWASPDNYQVRQMPTVYITELLPTGATDNTTFVLGHIFVPQTADRTELLYNWNLVFSECEVKAATTCVDGLSGGNLAGSLASGLNAAFTGGGTLTGLFVGGIFNSDSGDGIDALAAFQGDSIICVSFSLNGVGTSSLDSVCFYGSSNNATPANFFCSATVSGVNLYGNYSLSVGLNSNGVAAPGAFLYTSTAVAAFKGVAIIGMDDASVAIAEDTSVTPSARYPGRTLTPANIDASIASGGFGGIATGYLGSVIGPLTLTPPTPTAYVATVAHGGTGLGTLTAHAVLLGEGSANVGFATIGTAGRVLTDNGAGVDPTFQTPSTAAGTVAFTAFNSNSTGANTLTGTNTFQDELTVSFTTTQADQQVDFFGQGSVNFTTASVTGTTAALTLDGTGVLFVDVLMPGSNQRAPFSLVWSQIVATAGSHTVKIQVEAVAAGGSGDANNLSLLVKGYAH